MRIHLLSFLLILVFAPGQELLAQPITAKGKLIVNVSSESGDPVLDATISLKRKKDSVLVKTGITGKDGKSEIENLKEGNYFIVVTHIGYIKASGKPFSINETQSSVETSVLLKPAEVKSLNEVTVTAKKPFIER
ncbi:MAG TPA: carboxypeptidase regulatory-like domain-containing protein, partial [Chitinophagaceae bacterium]|nr:carboxypeptidase regulatory-like domain-containing protein [Chitinophagaceae bacterium]